MDTRAKGPEPDIIGIDKPNNSSAYSAILWITFVVALGATVFLFMVSRSTQNALAAKQQTKSEIESELASPSYSNVEAKANSFKEAFDILTVLSSERMPKKDLLDELYKNFTNDVTINNLAIGDDGSLTIDGATYSYRTVADFITLLKQYKRISDLKLTTASVDASEGVPDSKKIVFSITAKIDTKKAQPVAAETKQDDSTSSSSSTVEDVTASDETVSDDTLNNTSDSYDSVSSGSYDDTTSSDSDLVTPDGAGSNSSGI